MRRAAWTLAMFVVLLGVLVVAVFPTRTYLDQRQQLADAESRLEILGDQNHQLADRVAELHTDAAIERLAREQYNLVRPGEEAYAILPGPEPRTPPVPPAVPDRGFWSDLWDDLTFWN